MVGLGLLTVALLVAAVAGQYQVFSYLAALLIVGVVGASSIERGRRELDLHPYTGLLGGLLLLFLIGLTGIWLLWTPGQTEYTYVLGVPRSTLFYLVFIWVLPLLGAVYYAVLFPVVGGDEVVSDIMTEVRSHQSREEFPLAPERATVDAGGAGPGGAEGAGRTDGGDRE